MGKMDVYEIVTQRIIKKLEEGIAPWQKPWAGGGAPANFITKRPYRGFNSIALSPIITGFRSRYWGTYNQISGKGGQVRRGEKSTPIVFWKFWEQEQDGEKSKRFIVRYFSAFNLEQQDGIEVADGEKFAWNPIEKAESIVSSWNGPTVKHGGVRACYAPAVDIVTVPERSSFAHGEDYFGTLFHEMAHSTGHASRLNRSGITDPSFFGSHTYSKEELIAEMGAAFLCAESGIIDSTLDNSAAYLQCWLGKLKQDPKMLVHAASAAQKAVDMILGRKADAPQESESEVEVEAVAA